MDPTYFEFSSSWSLRDKLLPLFFNQIMQIFFHCEAMNIPYRRVPLYSNMLDPNSCLVRSPWQTHLLLFNINKSALLIQNSDNSERILYTWYFFFRAKREVPVAAWQRLPGSNLRILWHVLPDGGLPNWRRSRLWTNTSSHASPEEVLCGWSLTVTGADLAFYFAQESQALKCKVFPWDLGSSESPY